MSGHAPPAEGSEAHVISERERLGELQRRFSVLFDSSSSSSSGHSSEHTSRSSRRGQEFINNMTPQFFSSRNAAIEQNNVELIRHIMRTQESSTPTDTSFRRRDHFSTNIEPVTTEHIIPRR